MKVMWPAVFCLLLAATGTGQSIMPQIADGGNWRTAIQIVNTSITPGTVSLTFLRDTTGGATESWNPPFVEVASTQNLAIPAAGTLYLHTPGTASTLSQGWAQVTGTPGLIAYAIYTYESLDGRPDQDGTSQAVSPAAHMLVPFDNTSGLVTSVAIVNPTATMETVSVTIQTDAGVVSHASLPAIPANGQTAFVTGQQLPATAGQRGLAIFDVSGSNESMAIAAFRFNPTLALTSSPVFGPNDLFYGNLPQIADGANWRTQVVLVNATTTPQTVNVNFFQDTTSAATEPWNPPFQEINSTQNIVLPGYGTLFLTTPGTAASLSQGWGSMTTVPGVVAYAIYTYESLNGRPDQDGTAGRTASTGHFIVPFDNTPGFATSLAVANTTAAAETVFVSIQTDAGDITQTSLPPLPGNGQIAFVSGDQLPATAGHRGVMELITLTGQMSVAAFRFNPTLALTSSPTIGWVGNPVVRGYTSALLGKKLVVDGSMNIGGQDVAIRITGGPDGATLTQPNGPPLSQVVSATFLGLTPPYGTGNTITFASPATARYQNINSSSAWLTLSVSSMAVGSPVTGYFAIPYPGGPSLGPAGPYLGSITGTLTSIQ
jgi:hypothetical protein